MGSQDFYKYVYSAFLCPVQSHWKHRADTFCGFNSSYFCLYDKNKIQFVEFCRDHHDFEAPGRKNVVAGSFNGTLQRADCNIFFYQPFKFLTSGNSRCVYKTSYCSEKGQVVYENGTKKHDILCRCDYTRGYHFIIQPKHRCYCVPSEEDCSCHLKECPTNYILSPDYDCLNENEWKPSFHCGSISTLLLPNDLDIPLLSDISSLRSYVIAHGKAAGVFVLVVFMLILSIPIIYLVLPIIKDCLCRMKRKRTDADEKIDLEKYELKNKICRLEKSIGHVGKTPDHVLDHTTLKLHICQAHRDSLGIHWRRNKHSCCYPNHNEKSKAKPDRGTTPSLSKQYWLKTRKTIPVGSDWRKEVLLCWSNVHANFFVTRAAKSVYQRIQTETLVAIVGPTGTGKSACAYHTAFRLMSEYEYTIIPAQKPSDVTQYYLPGTNQVFIIDDFIGKYEFDETEAVLWEKEGPLIQKIFSNNGQTKVILTCRKSIWHPEVCERSGLSAFVCDIHTDDLRLTLSEKRTIYEAYFKTSNINTMDNEMIMMYPFFPLLCSIFSSKDIGSVENFFSLPVQFFAEEIDNYKRKSPVRYISLGVLAIEQKIHKKSFLDVSRTDELINNLFGESGSNILPSKRNIISHLDALTDTYVKVDNGCYEFFHQTMQTIVLYCISKTFINSVLKFSKSDVIKNQVQLECIKDKQNILVIQVTPEHEEAYFTRLERDLSEGQFVDVFENSQSAFPIFRQKFVDYLKNNGKGKNWKPNEDGFTVLHVVSSLGYEDFASYFLQLDTGMINKTDLKGNTPLHLAAMNGHLDIVKLLVEIDRNVHVLNNDKLSPFFYACGNNSISVVKYLVSLDEEFFKIDKKYVTRENKSVLHIASLNGSNELLKILVEHQASVNIQDQCGATPLHLACITGQYDTASLLLKARATVDALDKLERTPVYYACTGDFKNIVELLIENKANINKSASNDSTPLHAACEKDSTDIVNILLQKGSTVDVQEKSGVTPLHLTCKNGNELIVKLLIDKKASVNAKTKDQMRPFHEACKNGHLNIVDILLVNNVKYDKANTNGRTGLFLSCANGYNNIVKTILNRKADVNLTDKDGVTALHVACMNNHKDVVSTLLEKKANVNVTDVRGETPLYKACVNGNIEIVKILLSNSAHVKKSGLSSIAIAKENGFSDIVDLLNNVKN